MLQKSCLFGLLLFLLANVGENLYWWQTSIIYQIYPRSFKDSNGDGVGDLQGIITKLDYFTDLGVESFWLSPVYKSPMRDFGYDISNFTDIDPLFGTLADIDQLIDQAHKKGLNVIMDFVPGHTSTDHEWFNMSQYKIGNYTNYYIWNDGITLPNGTRLPPNNWLSVFSDSAWTFNPIRQQWYYHAFLPEQADLNYRDANVQEEMKNVLRFWLDKKVDGFRVDAIEKLYEVENVSQNEPPSGLNVPPNQYDYLNHTLTSNLPETIQTVTDWYNVVNEYKMKDNKDRLFIIELYAEPAVRNKLYATGGSPFNFDLIDFPNNGTGYDLLYFVNREYDNLPSGKWPNFVLGNHDRRRISHKFGSQYVDVYNMLLLTLWGTPTTYYGEEYGMLEGIISWNQTVDPWGKNFGPSNYEQFSRDPERTPMQWTGGYQAGFTNGTSTWLPLGQNYTTINVETEKNTNGSSSIKLYMQLAKLRKNAAFQTSRPKIAVVDTNVFSYFREGGEERYLVVLNIGKMNATVNFTANVSMDSIATVVAYTPGCEATYKNIKVDLDSVKLQPGDGVVFQIGSSSTSTTKKPNAAPGLRSAILTQWILPLLVSIIMWLSSCINTM